MIRVCRRAYAARRLTPARTSKTVTARSRRDSTTTYIVARIWVNASFGSPPMKAESTRGAASLKEDRDGGEGEERRS